MGYYSTEPADSAGVGNGKTRFEGFSADCRRKFPARSHESAAREGFCAVGNDTCTLGVRLYGYRHYSPELGRWPSRDPISERGGLNVYGFVTNRSLLAIDRLGLIETIGHFRLDVDVNESATGADWMLPGAPWSTSWGYLHFAERTRPGLARSGAWCSDAPAGRSWSVTSDATGLWKGFLRVRAGYANVTVPYQGREGEGTANVLQHEMDHLAHMRTILRLKSDCLDIVQKNCVCRPCLPSVEHYLDNMLRFYFSAGNAATLRMDEYGQDESAAARSAIFRTTATMSLDFARQRLALRPDCFPSQCTEEVSDALFPITGL